MTTDKDNELARHLLVDAFWRKALYHRPSQTAAEVQKNLHTIIEKMIREGMSALETRDFFTLISLRAQLDAAINGVAKPQAAMLAELISLEFNV